jgi:predicted RND superfamily exporter protein
MLNGFGAERIGLSALRHPIAATLLLAVVTLLALAGLPRLALSGANVDILRDGSKEIADYDSLLADFRNFNNDAVVLIRSPNLAIVEGIEKYRDLQFEFSFDERVESVLSLFSLVRHDPATGGWQSVAPARFENDEEVRAFLERIATEIPNSRSLLGVESGSAVMVVYVKPDMVQDAEVGATIHSFQELIEPFRSDGFDVALAGQPAIRAGLIDNIVSDLSLLIPVAAIFCGLIAFAIFRNPVSVLITALPPLLSVIWLLGGMALAGVPLNFLTNILPVLLIVVVFADALHLFLHWQAHAGEGEGRAEALETAIRKVGPACSLSTLTSAVALFSLVLAHNSGLQDFGVIGGLAMLASLFATLAAMPLAIRFADRAGWLKQRGVAAKMSVAAGPMVRMLGSSGRLVAVGFAIAALGLVAHFSIDSRFSLVDYVSSSSAIADSEGFIDRNYPGSTPLFAMVDLDRTRPVLDEENLKRFHAVLDAVGAVFPSSSFYSLANFRDELAKNGIAASEKDLDALPGYLVSRFISQDRGRALITIFSSANLSADQMQAIVDRLKGELAARGVEQHASLSGFPILSAVVAPRLMDNLRVSLMSAIALSIGIIALAAASLRQGLACLLPNLLPILCVELALWLAGIPLNMSVAVALTVAFGLAVNNSIHLLNQYRLKAGAQDAQAAVGEALSELMPAMLSTTFILCAGMAIMLFSTLPAIALFSAVMFLTLILALIFDVFQLPAHLLVAERFARQAPRKASD